MSIAAVEEEERVDEERQVGDETDVDGAVVLDDSLIQREVLGEVQVHAGNVDEDRDGQRGSSA
jgi:hypothetical protein